MTWKNFKKTFEETGNDIHTGPFLVEWQEDFDAFQSLRGKIEGRNQELTHDVTFTVSTVKLAGMPQLYDVRWKMAGVDYPVCDKEPCTGRVIVSSPFLAAVAIHFDEVFCNQNR